MSIIVSESKAINTTVLKRLHHCCHGKEAFGGQNSSNAFITNNFIKATHYQLVGFIVVIMKYPININFDKVSTKYTRVLIDRIYQTHTNQCSNRWTVEHAV